MNHGYDPGNANARRAPVSTLFANKHGMQQIRAIRFFSTTRILWLKSYRRVRSRSVRSLTSTTNIPRCPFEWLHSPRPIETFTVRAHNVPLQLRFIPIEFGSRMQRQQLDDSN